MKRLPILILRAVGIGLLMGAATCTCVATYNPYYDYCDPAVPSSECYRTRRAPESEGVEAAEEIASKYIETHPVEEELWDWKSGVLMHALYELSRVTTDTQLQDRLRNHIRSWLDYHIEQGYTLVWSDSCPPAISAIAFLADAKEMKSTDEQLAAYQQVVDDTLFYLDETAPRTDAGGISHNGTLGRRSVWLDSLFMFGMVLNRYGEHFDESRLEMMSEQVQLFADALQDESGLMRHAEDWPGYDETIYWARGNSWVVASLADYLRILAERRVEDSDAESDPEVEAVFRSHVQAILTAQDDETGLWWNIIDRPDEIYTETSASALFAYGLARAYRYGLLDDSAREAAERAVAGVVQQIEDTANGPVVTGVSLATDPWSYEEYARVPLGEDVNYGVGAVILALIETSFPD